MTPPIIISGFLLAQVSHVRRQGNRSVHILAKHAKDIVNSDNFVIWIEENPSLIESVSYIEFIFILIKLQVS